MEGVLDRLTALETKVEVFWRDIAVGAAKQLHSPHPERAELDRLLEEYLSGELHEPDKTELVKYLKLIEESPPGTVVVGKAVQPGDQIAAIIVLRVLEMESS